MRRHVVFPGHLCSSPFASSAAIPRTVDPVWLWGKVYLSSAGTTGVVHDGGVGLGEHLVDLPPRTTATEVETLGGLGSPVDHGRGFPALGAERGAYPVPVGPPREDNELQAADRDLA